MEMEVEMEMKHRQCFDPAKAEEHKTPSADQALLISILFDVKTRWQLLFTHQASSPIVFLVVEDR